MNILGFIIDKHGREASELIKVENNTDIKSEDEFYKHMSIINDYINICKSKCKQKTNIKNFILKIYFSLNSKTLIIYEEDLNNRKSFKRITAKDNNYNAVVLVNIYNKKRSFYHIFNYEYIQTSSWINNMINIINMAKSLISIKIPYLFGLIKREYIFSKLENMGYNIDMEIYLFKEEEIKLLNETIHTNTKGD